MSFLLLLACASEVREVTVSGTDGVPEVTWTGADAEKLSVSAVDGTLLWNIYPQDADACTNPLKGHQGVVWGELPEGYASVDLIGEPLQAEARLEDGSYSVGVAVCDEITDTGGSYFNKGASFVITDGVVEQLVAE